jgi:hypothetical protein
MDTYGSKQAGMGFRQGQYGEAWRSRVTPAINAALTPFEFHRGNKFALAPMEFGKVEVAMGIDELCAHCRTGRVARKNSVARLSRKSS